MFDATTTFTLGLRTSAGKTDVTVRWPTDEEWSAHRKRRKILQHQIGRGRSEVQVETGEGDGKLYEAIKLNGAPPLTEAEAKHIVDTIGLCDVVGVDLRADDAEVEMQTVMGPVKHVTRIPNMDQMRALTRAQRLINLPYNRQEIRTTLESSAALWDDCHGRGEGYVGAVPNLHKDVAIRAVISAIEQEAAPQYDEGNF
jgi:hypothetical protein